MGHRFTTEAADRELALPGWLRAPATLSAQLVTGLALLALLTAGVRRRGLPVGPWWLWAIPLLTLVVTVPMVGNPLKRAPLDPFLILPAAAGLTGAARAWGDRPGARRPVGEPPGPRATARENAG